MKKERYQFALLIDYLVSEYSDLLIEGLKGACREASVDLFILPIGQLHSLFTPYNYQYPAVTSLVNSNNFDGIIFVSGTQMHSLTKAELISYVKSFQPMPLVNISCPLEGIPSVSVDCSDAYKVIISELVNNQKCKKFGVFGVRSSSYDIKSRMNNIKNALEENGIKQENVTYWKSNFTYHDSINELESYFSIHKEFDCDALICLSDEVAFAVMEFARKHKIRVPEDLAVAGYDALDRGYWLDTSLSTISQDIPEQGRQIVRLLKEFVETGVAPESVVIDAKPVLRNSTKRVPYKTETIEKCILQTERSPFEYNPYSATEWYSKRDQLIQLSKFYSEMNHDITDAQLKKRINDDLSSFGVSACAIVLYDTPVEMPTPFDYFNLPHKASVFSAYDQKNGLDSSKDKKNRKFNPNEGLLPEGLLEYDSDGLFVISLFHATLQYGYIVFRRGSFDITIYDMLSRYTSSIIASAYSYSLVHDEHVKMKQKYNRLGIVASTDELTGLANRRGLFDFGETTLQFAKAMNQEGIVVYCDMDGLKKINDTYGHEAGDRAILAESVILKGNFRSNDIVARIGGDEFVIISPGLTEEAFKRISKQVNEDCRKWTEDNNSPFELSISMGYICYPSEKVGYQITLLLSEADANLYIEKRLKKAGKKR